MNRGEGERHLLAAELFSRLGRRVLVPVTVLVEVDLLLRRRGHAEPAAVLGAAVLDGVHRLIAPTDAELHSAYELGRRYPDAGVDIVDLSVMAVAASRGLAILTWDFRHFRSVVLHRGHHWPLVVDEGALPPA
jgi:predicted nucleic acid-binding protein